jgi:hypothetical protein
MEILSTIPWYVYVVVVLIVVVGMVYLVTKPPRQQAVPTMARGRKTADRSADVQNQWNDNQQKKGDKDVIPHNLQ